MENKLTMSFKSIVEKYNWGTQEKSSMFAQYNFFICKTGKYQSRTAMLQHSNKPQVLRLHDLEQKERQRFGRDFGTALTELFPANFNKKVHASPFLRQLVKVLPDIYYTLTTLLYCKRRLGEEYTYIAMYKQQHFEKEGVLLNKKTRILLSILQLVGRNLFLPLVAKIIETKGRGFEQGNKDCKGRYKLLKIMSAVGTALKEGVGKWLGSAQDIMSNVEWFVLMVYMLGWNKHFTFIESLLGISYVYTYKNDQIRDVSYAVEGYLLLATFVIKAAKTLYSAFTANKQLSKAPPKPPQIVSQPQKQKANNSVQRPLCRICYDQVKNRSSTKCGHMFCWSCIIHTLEINAECPVCRAPCQPREVIQLRNY